MKQLLIAGDTLDFLTTVIDYPASAGWTLSFRLVPQSAGTAYTFSAAAENDDYRSTVTAATTASWAAGEYSWSSYVTKGSERYTVDSGFLTIKANPATVAAGTDLRSHARKALAAVEAVIEGRASLDQEEYTINGRSLKRTPVADLIRLRSFYKSEVAREEAAERLAKGLGANAGRLLVRF